MTVFYIIISLDSFIGVYVVLVSCVIALTSLLTTDNFITDDGAEKLAEGMRYNNTVQGINLQC